MATVEKEFTIPEVCRMCLEDLSFATEYYNIEGELRSIVSKLVFKIDPHDDRLPLNMCTNCFNILVQFNTTKNCWIENQTKLEEESLKVEIQELVEVEQEPESQLELTDDSQGEYDYPVEYIDELEELNETEFATEDLTTVKEEIIEESSPPPSQQKRRIHNTQSKAKKTSGDSKEKGKDIYRKLLKKCEECSKMIEKNRMEGHMNKHRNYRPYVCDVGQCGKTFYCKLLLRLHRTSIHTDRSVKCDVCDKRFPSERALYSHKLRHRNENRYKCLYCDRKFNNTNSLKRHHAIHSGIREYACEYCTSSFYRKFNLDVHIKAVHNKDKKHLCNFPNCTKKFGYARLLRDHIRKTHIEEIEVQGEEYMTPNIIES